MFVLAVIAYETSVNRKERQNERERERERETRDSEKSKIWDRTDRREVEETCDVGAGEAGFITDPTIALLCQRKPKYVVRESKCSFI